MTRSPITDYIVEEVWRQGHDVEAPDGLQRVAGMIHAWSAVLQMPPRPLEIGDVIALGRWIEPCNAEGFRKVAVRVGRRIPPEYHEVPHLVKALLTQQNTLEPLEFYREFELIHPFEDGNGRVGKILLNWSNRTLLTPVFPPDDFWGTPILNP